MEKSIKNNIKKFIKLILTLIIFAIFAVAIPFAITGWLLCGGGGVLYLIIMMIIAFTFMVKLIKKIWQVKKKNTSKNKDTQTLINYINISKEYNLSEKQIYLNLQNNGLWEKSEIDEAFKIIKE